MARSTEITVGLKRLLRLCPEIILDKRSIQLIIDGKQNQVILEYNKNDSITDTIVEEIAEVVDNTVVVTESINTETNDDSEKSFNEYFS